MISIMRRWVVRFGRGVWVRRESRARSLIGSMEFSCGRFCS